MPVIPLIVKGGNLPLNYEPTAEEYYAELVRRLTLSVDGSRVILGSTDGTEPAYNVGPWLNNGAWYTWDEDLKQYTPAGFGLASGAFKYASNLELTADRTLTMPDKSGTAALIYDVFVPRDTKILSTTAMVADWSQSNSFVGKLSGNTTMLFTNVSEGQKVVIALMNTGTSYTVTWPTSTRWTGGAAPAMPTATAGNNAVAVYVFRAGLNLPNTLSGLVQYAETPGTVAAAPPPTVTPSTPTTNYGGSTNYSHQSRERHLP